MTPLEEEVIHLMNLMNDKGWANCQTYCLVKAAAMAKEDPEFYAGLVRKLREAMKKRGSPVSSASGQ